MTSYLHDPEYLTIAEVANHLRVKPPTVRSLIRDGDLKAYRISPKVTRVRRADLDEFLRYSTSQPTINDTDTEE